MMLIKDEKGALSLRDLSRADVKQVIRGLNALKHCYDDSEAFSMASRLDLELHLIEMGVDAPGQSDLDRQITEAEAEIEETARIAREAWAKVQELEKKRVEVLRELGAVRDHHQRLAAKNEQAQAALRRLRNQKENQSLKPL